MERINSISGAFGGRPVLRDSSNILQGGAPLTLRITPKIRKWFSLPISFSACAPLTCGYPSAAFGDQHDWRELGYSLSMSHHQPFAVRQNAAFIERAVRPMTLGGTALRQGLTKPVCTTSTRPLFRMRQLPIYVL